MKYLKTYEQKHYELEVGDYVVCERKQYIGTDIGDFFAENIGKLVSIDLWNQYHPYKVQYDIEFYKNGEIISSKYDFNKKSFQFLEDPDGVIVATDRNILFYSKDKKECEEFIEIGPNVKKYNL